MEIPILMVVIIPELKFSDSIAAGHGERSEGFIVAVTRLVAA